MEVIKEQTPKILFVDDERSILRSLVRFSRSRSWDAHIANSGHEALSAIAEQDFEVVVSDMRMPGMTGDVLLTYIKELSPNTVRVLLTGYADIEAIEAAINKAKIYEHVTKPWDEEVLEQALNSALGHYKH